MSKKFRKVCYVVCYKDPNYIRTKTLTAAIRLLEEVELIEVKNKHRGILRYIEVPLRLIYTRLRYRPSVFVVGFRSQEIFWALYPAMIGKPKIFDEFINTHDYLISEHKKLSEGSFFIKVLDVHMRWIIGRCNHILTDTPAHAKLSSQIYNVKSSKFLVVPVGTDEAIFRPQPKRVNKRFTVLFYGTMLPLHGMEFILDAVKILKQNNQLLDTKIVLIGGRGNSKMQTLLQGFIEENSLKKNIKLIDWVDYQKLPQHIAAADICLGGPFGATGQASRVVTGKTYQFLAMAKPTIIGQIDGVPEFKDKINCLLVQRGNAASLAEAIAWASNHQKELTAISRAGRKLYEEEFSLKKISEELVKIL